MTRTYTCCLSQYLNINWLEQNHYKLREFNSLSYYNLVCFSTHQTITRIPGTCLHNPVLLLQPPVLLHQGVDTVYHALHQLNLGIAEPVFVRDIIGHPCLPP